MLVINLFEQGHEPTQHVVDEQFAGLIPIAGDKLKMRVDGTRKVLGRTVKFIGNTVHVDIEVGPVIDQSDDEPTTDVKVRWV